MKKEYEVYSPEIRDAQMYFGDINDPDMEDDMEDGDWRDISQDMLLDIVFAENEEEAVRIVAENEQMTSGSSLYAIEHVADTEPITIDDVSRRMSATSYSTDDAVGIQVELVCGEFLKIETDKTTGKVKVLGWNPETVYEVLAHNDEVDFLVCFATTEEKALALSVEWAKAIEITDEEDCCYEFLIRTVDIDRIGFNEDIIVSNFTDITEKVLQAL